MRITITGPRSVGKSTISRIVAKKLKLKYISSDEIGDKAMKKYGGLDKAIKAGIIGKFIKKSGYGLIRKEYRKDNFVFDLSGGSVSSNKYKEASRKVREIAKRKSIVISLLPYKKVKMSVNFLFKREKKRKHFKNMPKDDLFKKVIRNYRKYPSIVKNLSNHIIYTENKTPIKIADEIINKINRVK